MSIRPIPTIHMTTIEKGPRAYSLPSLRGLENIVNWNGFRTFPIVKGPFLERCLFIGLYPTWNEGGDWSTTNTYVGVFMEICLGDYSFWKYVLECLMHTN